MKKEVNDTTYDRPSKDMATAKNDVGDLTDQISDAINALARAAKRQAQSGYNAAQGATTTAEETLEDIIVRRPLATAGLASSLAIRAWPGKVETGFPKSRSRSEIEHGGTAMATSKTTSLLSEWRRWWKTLAFVDALYKSRRNDTTGHH
jgi:hypothetical protein